MTRVDIISGFLGAGKTTLIKKLLKEALAGQKIVLIENEFGEIGIDGGFLKEAGIQITEMNSGCICCSLVGDFGEALKKVLTEYAPDRIIIEPSGVGKLSDVARAVERVKDEGADLAIGSLVTVADAHKAKIYMKNFGEFYNNQVEAAQTVVLSRTGDMSEEKVLEVVAMLREKNPAATIVTTDWTEITGATILDAIDKTASLAEQLFAEEEVCPVCGHHHHHDDDDDDDEDNDQHSCDCHHHHDDDEEEQECEHECGCGHHHEDHDEHSCGHHHHHHDDDDEEHECGCHHHHHHHDDDDDECECGCHHHHDDDDDEEHECGCHHHHDDDEHECGCHHHHNDDEEHECGCHHHHEDDEEHECGCHHHHDDEDEEHECGCHHHHHDHHHHHHDADEVFTSWGRETAKKYDEAKMENILTVLEDSTDYGVILRAKGIVPTPAGEWLHFDLVPGEHEIRKGTADYTGRLCVIGSKLNEEELEKLFNL